MKRAANLGWLVDRCTPWLAWWQELILNWVASWSTVSTLVVVSADGELQCSWSLPSDLEIDRQRLEQTLLQERCDT
jgi:hypothetical protein